MKPTDKKPLKLKAKDPSIVQPGHTKALVFGPSGVGKTWFTLSFPSPYYIDTEGGADLRHYQERLKQSGGAYLGPQDGALDFDVLIDQMEALATQEHSFKTLIIDSITKLYQSEIAKEATRLGDKDAFGASKKPAIAYMRKLVNWSVRLDMNILFVAHEVSEWGIDPKTGQRTEIGRVADVWDKLPYELDLALQAQRNGASRIAIVRKSRLTGFPDQDRFPLEYSVFAERYGKDFIEAKPKAIVLATENQVKQIESLLEVVKVPEDAVSKIFTKAGADSWSEITSEQAATTIKWLTSKLPTANS